MHENQPEPLADGPQQQCQKWDNRFAPHLRLDPASELDRLLVDHFGDILENIEPWKFTPPIGDSTRARYEGMVTNFTRWCAHEQLIANDEQPQHLDAETLRTAAQSWLAWRAQPCDPDHPLTITAARKRGDSVDCGYRAPSARKKLDHLRDAIKWWAVSAGIDDPLSGAATQLRTVRHNEPTERARPLTDIELVAAVRALTDETVVTVDDLTRVFDGVETRLRAWHYRELAALNITVAVSLRRTSELPRLTDSAVTAIDPDGVTIHLAKVKNSRTRGRTIKLRPRDDALCPLWALTRWLQLCAELGWDRQGLLLPAVRPEIRHALAPIANNNERRSWKRVTDHLGITTTVDGAPTPHGLRAMSPTRAAEAGWDPVDLMELGGWQTLDSAAGYVRAAPMTERPDGIFDVGTPASGAL